MDVRSKNGILIKVSDGNTDFKRVLVQHSPYGIWESIAPNEFQSTHVPDDLCVPVQPPILSSTGHTPVFLKPMGVSNRTDICLTNSLTFSLSFIYGTIFDLTITFRMEFKSTSLPWLCIRSKILLKLKIFLHIENFSFGPLGFNKNYRQTDLTVMVRDIDDWSIVTISKDRIVIVKGSRHWGGKFAKVWGWTVGKGSMTSLHLLILCFTRTASSCERSPVSSFRSTKFSPGSRHPQPPVNSSNPKLESSLDILVIFGEFQILIPVLPHSWGEILLIKLLSYVRRYKCPRCRHLRWSMYNLYKTHFYYV